METRSPFYVVIRDKRRSSRLQCKGSTFISKTLSIGPTPGIELATFRSAVKRSTDCANPAAVTRFGFHSLNRRRNLTPVSNVCKAAARSLFWTPTGFNALPEVCFEFPFNIIGELAMASLTGQSWRVLKSWYTGGGLEQMRIWALFPRRFLPGFGYVTSATATFSLQGYYSGQLFITAELSLLRQARKLQLPINTDFHLEVQKLFNMRTYERNLEQK